MAAHGSIPALLVMLFSFCPCQAPCAAEWREDELFAELPAALRGEVAGVLLLGTLRSIPTFAECGSPALSTLSASSGSPSE